MKKLFYLILITIFIGSCGGGKTSEEMRQDHIKAEQIREQRRKEKVAADNQRQLNKLKRESNRN